MSMASNNFIKVCDESIIVGWLYFKRGLNNKVRLTLMTIMFLGLILQINIA